MKKKDRRFGFTIIEVVLVLGIAGLIFMMVFIALPALQRQTRDTQRREDMSDLISAIKKYQTNNRGALPSDDDWSGDAALGPYLKDGFMDPNGEKYNLSVEDCGGASAGAQCGASADETPVDEASFPNNYKVYIYKGATCDGETAVKSANNRKVAVLYKLEGGGIYCGNS